MRNGILLAEDSPENIMTMFNSSTLEDAFLILSQKQGQSEEADNTLRGIIEAVDVQDIEGEDQHAAQAAAAAKATEMGAGRERLRRNMSFAEQKPPGLWGKLLFTSKTRMTALMTKNVLQIIRQPS